MLSKLTFSLASLIVLLMVVVCLPVDAQMEQTVDLPQPTAVPDDDVAVAGVIPSGGFAVFGVGDDVAAAGLSDMVRYTLIAEPGMQDLEVFFMAGGTVQLVLTGADTDGDTDTDARAPAMKDLVISEIMWGLDASGVDADGKMAKQWIEIYNTTDADITLVEAAADVDGVLAQLVFTPFTLMGSATAVVATDATNVVISDTVSNVGTGGKWTMPGQSGVTMLGIQVNAPLQSNLVSAYRNIDYVKVTGFHKLTPQNTVMEPDNRVEQLKGIPDGVLAGSWIATPAAGSRYTERWHIGSPGMMHVMGTEFTFAITKTLIPSNSVVINEIRSDNSDADVDWVELYNAGTTAVGLRDWELSIIKTAATTATAKNDIRLVGKDKDDDDSKRFPANDVFKLKAGEYLLIVNQHPNGTSLANGVNIEEVVAGKDVKAGAMHQYIVRDTLQLKDAGMLILRSGLDKNSYHNKDDSGINYATSVAPSELIMDYAGNGFIAVDSSTYNTGVWPFRGWVAPTSDTEGIPSGNAFARLRYNADDSHHKDAWDNIGHKGGIGYDPGVNLRDAPGTPGYANNALMTQLVDDKDTAVTTDDVSFAGDISISEIMYDAGPRWHLIQWIELYNSSMTEAINLKDWELEIRNATDEVESYVDSSLVFNDAYILPNQTLLLVSGTAVNDVSDNRVYNLYQHHRRELGLTNRRSVLLSPGGFYLRLNDKNEDMVDEAGNVMVDGARRTVAWELLPRGSGDRQSLVRQYGTRAIDGSPDVADPGAMASSWQQSNIGQAGLSYYGHRNDVGTPGYRLGGPLPVSLSSFRPVRDKNTGEVVIRWITESELNNAGFNILRSESKNGEFQVVNLKGIIAGNGTTSERHVYEWTDTAAKPNVVYYYQIEDVSLNGNRTTLDTTHLRGNVTVAGKATTTWADLKSLK